VIRYRRGAPENFQICRIGAVGPTFLLLYNLGDSGGYDSTRVPWPSGDREIAPLNPTVLGLLRIVFNGN
jgi:hypothetical protein